MLVDRDPGERAYVASGPLGEQRRLPVTGGCHHQHEGKRARGAKTVDQRGPGDRSGQERRYVDLRLHDLEGQRRRGGGSVRERPSHRRVAGRRCGDPPDWARSSHRARATPLRGEGRAGGAAAFGAWLPSVAGTRLTAKYGWPIASPSIVDPPICRWCKYRANHHDWWVGLHRPVLPRTPPLPAEW